MVLFHTAQNLAVEHIIVGKLCSYCALDTRKGKVLLAFHLHYDGFFVGKATCDVLNAFNRYKAMNFRILPLADCHLDVCVSTQVLLLQLIEDEHNGVTLPLVGLDFDKALIAFRSHLRFYLKHHPFFPFRQRRYPYHKLYE